MSEPGSNHRTAGRKRAHTEPTGANDAGPSTEPMTRNREDVVEIYYASPSPQQQPDHGNTLRPQRSADRMSTTVRSPFALQSNDDTDSEDEPTTPVATLNRRSPANRHGRKASIGNRRAMNNMKSFNSLGRPKKEPVAVVSSDDEPNSPPSYNTSPEPPKHETRLPSPQPTATLAPEQQILHHLNNNLNKQLNALGSPDATSTMHSFVGMQPNMYNYGNQQSILNGDMFQQPKSQYQLSSRNGLRRRRGAVSNGQDSDYDDNDDAMSVLKEAEEDLSRQENLERQNRLNKNFSFSIKHFVLRWTWHLVKALIIVGILMIPGLICYFNDAEECKIYQTNLFRFSLMGSLIVVGFWLASFIVKVAILIIRNMPVLGTHFLYYIHNISGPCTYVLLALFVHIGAAIIFQGTPILDDSTYRFRVDAFTSCFLVIAAVYLFKALLLRIIAIRFHRGAYYKRVKNALFAEWVLLTLLPNSQLGKSTKGFVSNMKSFVTQSGQTSSEDGGKKEKFRFSDLFKIFKKKESAPGEILSELPITEKEILDSRPISSHRFAVYTEFIKNDDFSFQKGAFKDALIQLKRSEIEALVGEEHEYGKMSTEDLVAHLSHPRATRLLANILFHQLTDNNDRRHTVDIDDFRRAVGPVLAQSAFNLFDGNWNGKITEPEMYSSLLAIARERKALGTALNDAETAVGKLDTALTGVAWLFLFIYILTRFEIVVDVQSALSTLSSFLLASAFAIGSSAKALLESIIFIFVTHPYDIGDRVVIDKVVYTVTKVNLLTSEMRRYDNSVFFFNNSVLSQKPILNLRRSPDQFDLIALQVSFYTPTSALKEFEQKFANFIAKHPAHFYGKFEIEYKELENSNRLIIRVWVQHRSNFQNTRRYRERRGRLLLRLKKICEDLGIEYELPVQRVVHDGLMGDEQLLQEVTTYAPVTSQFVASGGGLGMQSNNNDDDSKSTVAHYEDGMFGDVGPFDASGRVLDGTSMNQTQMEREGRLAEREATMSSKRFNQQ